jgi:hypothetical protein
MGTLTFRGISRKVSFIDVSAGGFSGVLLPEPLVPGMAISALVPLEGDAPPVFVRGVIAWTQGKVFGVSFGHLEPQVSEAIRTYLEKREAAKLSVAVGKARKDLRAA